MAINSFDMDATDLATLLATSGIATNYQEQIEECDCVPRELQCVTAMTAIAALIVTVYINHEQTKISAHEKLLDHRRAALSSALQVVDHTWSNEMIEGMPPTKPHKWDIQLARDADNQLRIYCADPKTHELFMTVLGVRNPRSEKPKQVSPAALDEFRKQVAEELELPAPSSDPDRIWIAGLEGAE
jgi:hypothetical protein